MALQASGIVGENDSFGDEIVQSGVWGRMSYSIGQFHYETDGFRKNNDQDQDIYNAFAQVALSHKTSIQAEYRYTDQEIGDLLLRFEPTDFSTSLKEESRNRTFRIGFHHAFTPRSDLIASVIYYDGDFDTYQFYEKTEDLYFDMDSDFGIDTNGYMAEIQHLFHSSRFRVISGLGHFNADSKGATSLSFYFDPDYPIVDHFPFNSHTHHINLYGYSLINYPKNVTWTLGASSDFFEGGSLDLDHDQFNPKLGLTWNPFSDTTLRAAAFRTLNRTLISNQTLEPTHVAGFNQFFDEYDGTESWVYGVGIDQEFSSVVYGGVEFFKRDMDVPFLDTNTSKNRKSDWEERLFRAYFYWTPYPWLSTNAEYQYERLKREFPLIGPELFTKVKTHRMPLGINFFHPSGLSAGLKATYIDQKGKFRVIDPTGGVSDDDKFWVIDASIGFRLPNQRGLITIEVRNLFDESFKFQDTDIVSIDHGYGVYSTLPLNPLISPERMILAKCTLTF
ncbi:MAG: hypothetical protein BA872_05200 [Desulfobacterales bacterium C00003060]|nr:MAG: hypothetical protein BA872_05200 [Desulfobacterales bacterium C00003060]